MSDAEPPMEAIGDKEKRSDENGADATEHGDKGATWKILQVCMAAVHYDHRPEDREADGQADETGSSSDLP